MTLNQYTKIAVEAGMVYLLDRFKIQSNKTQW